MSGNIDKPESKFDNMKWLLVIAVVFTAIWANQHYADQSVLIRAGGIIVSAIIAVLIALQTEKGRNVFNLARESRVEIRKVVWPTRQETVQTTLIVMVSVVIMSLLLWGIDAVLVKVVAFLTGQ